MYIWNSLVVFLKSRATRSRLARAMILSSLASLMICGSACSSDEGPETSDVSRAPAMPSLQKIEGSTPYSIDHINNAVIPKEGSVVVSAASTPTIVIAGWAVDVRAKAPAGGVVFNVDGKSDLTATYGVNRQDVVEVLKDPNYRTSGFGISIPTASLEKGHHTLSLKVLTADKKGYYEPNQKINIEVQ